MKRNILNSLYIVSTVILISSCRAKREVVVVPTPKENKIDHSKEQTLTLLNSKQLKFNTLALKAKATLNINGDADDVTMNFRIKNKETIWVSITAAGGIVEVARALITPDSIKILNKLKSEYLKKPFSYIYNFTNKQVNFNTLQAVITGNAVANFLTDEADLKQNNGAWVVSGSKENLEYKLLFNTLLKVSETNLNDAKNGQALKVTYTDYQKLNEYLFPSAMQINTLSDGKKISIGLQFIKIDGNASFDFPFNIPKRYTLVK